MSTQFRTEYELTEQCTLNFKLSMYDVLHNLPEDARTLLIESMACADEIIKNVMDQVLDGYTDNGFAGSTCFNRNTPLMIARNRIAKSASDVAKREIAELERKIQSLEAALVQANDDYNMLRYGER